MIEVNKDNFDEVVKKEEKLVLIDFWGPKCEQCLALMPEVEKLEQKYADKVKFCKLDASQNRRLCISLKVLGLPTFQLYKNGEKVDEISKDVTIEKIEEMIKRHI
ncbi:thioredoxin TrxA [Caldanaerobacter subterraneus]|uniref:Thioredoxin n=2 Tax=Caldanaerobacter subterraneus TaxID=911092 RepID=A0A4R2K1D8_9THEO|nr:thioredoxin domain-containing protein [Caldanaerobacter subterraneus]KKC29247.1 Thiol-disulfide isomerase [Caldanaerobacter subterraneus subsp. pacificus DSM 12653]MBE3593003.1 thioredoxin [Thermoanaerobacter sp.]MCS3915348.1 thioredoxin 1 [Caldanaerobacter subterraneus subsp. tengcongensis MB4]TCO63568.1 thioredoxin 1 [Caldanaerobacter subterraneus]